MDLPISPAIANDRFVRQRKTQPEPDPFPKRIAAITTFDLTNPVLKTGFMAHGRACMPAHLMGRNVTLLNRFGIGFIGMAQISTDRTDCPPFPPPSIALKPHPC